jgi:hypothetical protein
MSKQIAHRRSVSLAPLAPQAFVAGIIGAVLTDGFLSISQHVSPMTVWQHIAAAVVGDVAVTSASYAVLGVAVHLVIALAWAYLYAFVAYELNLLQKWVFSGIVWGIVVDVVMDLVLASRGALEPLTVRSVLYGLITNVIFYGLPVAWYLSRSMRTASRSSN